MKIDKDTTLIITGGAGFIGSNLIRALNKIGVSNIIIVDNFEHNPEKWRNLIGLSYFTILDWVRFYNLPKSSWVYESANAVVHLGGRADTRADFIDVYEMNYKCSMAVASSCMDLGIPMYYASSAATYGNTNLFSDNHELLGILEPNNAYAMSKHMFDILLTTHLKEALGFACGMKFFNVYGPGEMHKGEMASIIGRVLNSEDPFEFYHVDGWERDFIYIDDVVNIILFLMHADARGIYNVGSGESSSWLDVYNAIKRGRKNLTIKKNPNDLPTFFNKEYQKYSKADISKLRNLGYEENILSLTEGIKSYRSLL